MNNFKKQRILNINVNILSAIEFLNLIKGFLFTRKSHYICVSNVHQCIEAYDNKEFAEVINNADLVISDSRPIYWALKLFNHQEAEQLTGYNSTKSLCKFASENNLSIGFYGGEKDSLEKCVLNLKKEYQGIKIDYFYSPPFRVLTNEEKKDIISDINKSEIKFLFVCTGCPKQEYWMAEHKEYLNCISVGVGEVVDLISGKMKLTPKWIHNIGMRWLTRLIADPRRLFWRYFYTNSKFIYLFLKQYLKFKININK